MDSKAGEFLKKILLVAGARPNFMKIAPLLEEMNRSSSLHPLLVHTGQHYDQKMSKLFFDDLEIPKPDINLEVGSGSHAVQTAAIIQRFEPVLLQETPDVVAVVGDVNSSIACALTSVKLGIPVAHVEAGLRSFDRTMPEEVNRVLTDAISDILFTTEASANENLVREGIATEKIHFVGNVMIDTLVKHKEKANQSDILFKLGLTERRYGILTLHRPSNVEDPTILGEILDACSEIAKEVPLIFPCHPRTFSKLRDFRFFYFFSRTDQSKALHGIHLHSPFGYFEFLKLMHDARVVLTDSGGIQEETTILGVPCITLRENTERPVTVSEGTNVIAGTKKESIVEKTVAVLNKPCVTTHFPEFWDGRAAERIVRIFLDLI